MTGDTIVRPAVRMHGRSAQRRAVAALLDRLRTHGAGLVVTGEPGLGRTTLLRWAAHGFTAGNVLHLRAGPTDGPKALGCPGGGPEVPGAPPAAAGHVMGARRDPEAGADGRAGHPGHRPPPRAAAPRTYTWAPGPGVTPDHLLDAFRGAADGGPLLVCVDDAHRWDAAGRAALGAVAGRPPGHGPVGLLLSVAGHRA
ncbi:ATP-binding protein, partial [Streptomyces sp. NPDC023723]|uniref:ATP-binding protein n=1 Tax=Streptomyces sp. NPDC023723 TaxID=3154323 RepID=UPI0033DC3647